MSTPTTLERRFATPARGCRVTTAVRQHGAAAYELGDLHGLALWLQARARLARLSPVELQELRALARVLVRQASPIRRSLEQQLQAAAEQQVPASLSWEERQQLLVQREAQRRAGDRQPVTLVPAVAAAPRGRGRHKGAQPIGECGARLARKIDRLLAEIQGAPPPATAPGAGGAEVLAAAAAEPIPADLATAELQPLAESATADLHEQVLVAAAQADLEPEPLPVSIHALEAAWAAPAVAELSPRARAIAELGVARPTG